MVERLKEAIEKARQSRAGAPAASDTGAGTRPPGAGLPTVAADEAAWGALPLEQTDPARLTAMRIVSAEKTGTAHMPFDVLRTRLLKVCRENRWSRIAVTSPTTGCGKTFVALNLAFSLARSGDVRTLLVDLDLRSPAVQRTLGLTREHGIADYLAGTASIEAVCLRLLPSLAVAPGRGPVRDSAEVLLAPAATAALRRLAGTLAPDIVLYDLPPMLACDDALAFAPNVDAVLMVARAGVTTAAELTESEQLLTDVAPVLGIVLNRAENVDAEPYEYAYGNRA